jgi:hypothetical protein
MMKISLSSKVTSMVLLQHLMAKFISLTGRPVLGDGMLSAATPQ